MKWMGFLCLLGAGFGFGQLALSAAIQRKYCIEEGIALLTFIDREIQYTSAKPEEMFARMADLGTAPHFRCRSFQEVELPNCFTTGESHYFLDGIHQIGHLPSAQSSRQLALLTQWLEGLLEKQREVCRQGTRLYRQLGLCGGLALAILLL